MEPFGPETATILLRYPTIFIDVLNTVLTLSSALFDSEVVDRTREGD
jgi:hypothetical protein